MNVNANNNQNSNCNGNNQITSNVQVNQSSNTINNSQNQQHNNIFSKIKSVIKSFYDIVQIISTLSIFSGIAIFIVGKVICVNLTDDDLILNNIKKQVPKEQYLEKMYVDDIHGFGNESIVCIAYDNKSFSNSLFIYDKVENDVLNKLNSFFGFNYKLKYNFSLLDKQGNKGIVTENSGTENGHYTIELLDIVDLDGDLFKEIVVKFIPEPTTSYNIFNVAIFSYSFEDNNYYISGTFPNTYSGDVGYQETVFRQKKMNNAIDDFDYYDKKIGGYNLQECYGENYFHLYNNDESTYLVATNWLWADGESHISPHQHEIYIFTPYLKKDTSSYEWNLYNYIIVDEFVKNEYCDREYFEKILQKLGCNYLW